MKKIFQKIKEIFNKVKSWFISLLDGAKRLLSNFKLWLVKNIDFIKKCICVALLGLFCFALIPFSCKSSSNIAQAEEVDNSTYSYCVLDYLGDTTFQVANVQGSATIPTQVLFEFGLEFNSNNEVYFIARNTRTRIDNATSSNLITLPKVFKQNVYGSFGPNSFQIDVNDFYSNISLNDLGISTLTLDVSIDSVITNNITFTFRYSDTISCRFSILVRNASGVFLTSSINRSYTLDNILVYTSSSVDTAYEDGYNNGYIDGYEDGEYLGRSEGYDEGYELGYDEGYELGYDEGELDGYDIGKADGKAIGYEQGYENAKGELHIPTIFESFFSAISSFFELELFGGVTIGLLLQLSFGLILLGFAIKIFLGG